jgi:hypothetical protein
MSHNPDINSQAPITESRRAQRHAIEFRCKSADERKKIIANAEAENCDLSEYLRAKALNQKPQRRPTATGDRRGLIEALGQLGKIGSNLNQMAKALNQSRHVERAAIVEALQSVEATGAAIREALTTRP